MIVAAGTAWYAARAGGFLAYLLLSASVAVGLLLSGRARLQHWPRFALEDVHAFLGFLTGTFIVVHGGALLLDHVVPFSLSQLIVPGASGYRPLDVAFGVVAAELLAALAITNHYRKRLPHGLWRRLHMLNFAVWGLALAHGLTAGTRRHHHLGARALCGLGLARARAARPPDLPPLEPRTIERKEHAMAMRRKVIAGAAAALAVGGAGAGVAATKLATNSPSEESKAIVNDAAKSLGVEPSKLSAALKKAFEDRIDAAVADGRLTKAQGDELKQRIESGELPALRAARLRAHGPGGPHGFFHGLDAAASYLGLTEAELHSRLESGKTLAEIAKAQGKSVDGLKDAMVKDAKTKLDAAVKAGRLSSAEEQRILADLQQHVDDLVNGKLPDRRDAPRGFGFRDRQGPPPFADPAA